MNSKLINKETVSVFIGLVVGGAIITGCTNSTDNTAPATPPAVVSTPAPTATVVPAPAVSATGGVMTTAQTNNPNAGPGWATGAASDIGDAVVKAIHTNVQMTGSRIIATADASGVVRLTGTAQNQQQKALAERQARQTAGVTSVINKIEIVATGGIKSASTPKVIEKTKIVVIHDKATTPNPAPASVNSDSTTGSTGMDNSTSPPQ
jgi:hypothetical protein